LLDDTDKRSISSDGNIGNLDIKEQRSENSGNDEEITEDSMSTAEDQQAPEIGRYNLRSSREHTYNSRLAHRMDNPESSKRYNTQFLQQEITNIPSLWEAVEHMNDSGSSVKVFEYITGFMMTQMTVEAGIKKHG
jgi:hypothetical protein